MKQKPEIRDRIKELRRVCATDLVPAPVNWRTHSAKQRTALASVLEEIGIADAVLARELPDGRLQLIDGHLRRETLGESLLPVLVLDVSEREAAILLATIDPLAAMAGTDAEKLDAILREAVATTEGVQELLAEIADDAGLYRDDEKEIVEDEVPEPPPEPITRPGDLWILGDHRLFCGDSTKTEDVERLMAGAKADLCFTSPPYGQQRDYTKEGKEKCQDWDGLMRGVFGNLPMAEAGQVLVNLGLIHREGEWVPYWDGWIQWMREQGWRRFGWYVWDKGHPMPGAANGRLLCQHEWVFHFAKKPVDVLPTVPKTTPANGITWFGARDKLGEHDKKRFSRTDGNRVAGSVVACDVKHGQPADSTHPAIFPIRLVCEFVSPWRGSLYEPFLGSGTTLIAAEQLGRRCYGLEISPAYCDVIVARWEKLTGRKATLERSPHPPEHAK